VLIAGCGSIGKRHARILQGLGVKKIRACDPVPEQREKLAVETSVEIFDSYDAGLASRPDAVFVCTPPKMHIPMARQAVDAGAHVFCEKPLSFSSAGISELDSAAQQSNRVVMTGLCFRYHDGLRKAKSLVESGRFGRLVSVRCLMGENLPSVRPDYRDLFSSKYSGAFDLTHEVDLAVWYASRPVRQVTCAAGTYSDIGIEAPDVAEILITFDAKCLASIHLDFFQLPRRRQTELICTGGVVMVEFASWDRCTVSAYEAGGEWQHEAFPTARDDMFRAEDRVFLEAIAGTGAAECGIEDARISVEVIEQAMAAAGVAGSARSET
jgi:predicted dehydrogenase